MKIKSLEKNKNLQLKNQLKSVYGGSLPITKPDPRTIDLNWRNKN